MQYLSCQNNCIFPVTTKSLTKIGGQHNDETYLNHLGGQTEKRLSEDLLRDYCKTSRPAESHQTIRVYLDPELYSILKVVRISIHSMMIYRKSSNTTPSNILPTSI